MPFLDTPLAGLKIFDPKIFGDERGYFMETYNERTFHEAGIDTVFRQDNQAFSSYGVLRGLHLQEGEDAQAKLVRVVHGEVWDVALDLRPDSPTFRQWYGIYLNGENQRQLFIPHGFAHGYLVTSEQAIFAYKCDNFYAPQSERGFRYDDPAFGIEWPKVEKKYRIASRDLSYPYES